MKKEESPEVTHKTEGQRIGGVRLEKGQSLSRGAAEEVALEAVAREGAMGLWNGKFGKELLAAGFRARFWGRASEKTVLWLEIPHRAPWSFHTQSGA